MKKKRKSAKNVSEQKKNLYATQKSPTQKPKIPEKIFMQSAQRAEYARRHIVPPSIYRNIFLSFFFFCYKVAHGFNSIARQYSSLVTFPENLSGHRIGFLNSSAKSHSLSWQPCTFRTSETRTNRYPTPPTNQRRANKRSAVTNLAASRQIAQELIRPMGT